MINNIRRFVFSSPVLQGKAAEVSSRWLKAMIETTGRLGAGNCFVECCESPKKHHGAQMWPMFTLTPQQYSSPDSARINWRPPEGKGSEGRPEGGGRP